MKRSITAVLVVIVLCAIVAAQASAAPAARDPRVPALQRQVAQLTTALSHEVDLNQCEWTYQSHYNYGVLDILSMVIGSDRVTDATPSDGGACNRVGITTPTRTMQALKSPFALPFVWLLPLGR
jgi:hypothetical protein